MSEYKLSRLQLMLMSCLKRTGLDETRLIAVMGMLVKDEPAMLDLTAWIAYRNPTAEQVMNTWVAHYLMERNKKRNRGAAVS